MYALVLFDIDGCTAIIEAKKFKVPDVKALFKGQQASVQYQKKSLKVEVLELSESRAFLNKFEDDWSCSHRSIALDKEKRKRKNKQHGYLSVWPNDQEDVAEDQIETSNNDDEEAQEINEESNGQEERNIRKELKGSKGRKINIQYEGSPAADTSPNASPQRDPCFFNGISTDEAEVVELQMKHFSNGMICTSSQTEQVVVIHDEREIVDLLSRKQVESREVSTQTDTGACVDSMMQTDSPNCPDLAAVNRKLDEILGILQGGLENSLRCNNVSDIVRWVTANTSTPLPGCSAVTIVPLEEAVLEIPPPCESGLSPLLKTEKIQRGEELSTSPPDESASPNNSPAPKMSPPTCSNQPRLSPSLPVKRNLFEEDVENHLSEFVPNRFPTEPSSDVDVLPLMEVTHKLNTRQASKEEKFLEVEWSPTKTLKEIRDITDIIPGDYEFRIRRDVLTDAKTSACSDGNFMWILTRKLFRDDELIGRNFFGRKGRKPLSPRRKKCLKHAYMVACGNSNKDFAKAINSINNGIRSLGR